MQSQRYAQVLKLANSLFEALPLPQVAVFSDLVLSTLRRLLPKLPAIVARVRAAIDYDADGSSALQLPPAARSMGAVMRNPSGMGPSADDSRTSAEETLPPGVGGGGPSSEPTSAAEGGGAEAAAAKASQDMARKTTRLAPPSTALACAAVAAVGSLGDVILQEVSTSSMGLVPPVVRIETPTSDISAATPGDEVVFHSIIKGLLLPCALAPSGNTRIPTTIAGFTKGSAIDVRAGEQGMAWETWSPVQVSPRVALAASSVLFSWVQQYGECSNAIMNLGTLFPGSMTISTPVARLRNPTTTVFGKAIPHGEGDSKYAVDYASIISARTLLRKPRSRVISVLGPQIPMNLTQFSSVRKDAARPLANRLATPAPHAPHPSLTSTSNIVKRQRPLPLIGASISCLEFTLFQAGLDSLAACLPALQSPLGLRIMGWGGTSAMPSEEDCWQLVNPSSSVIGSGGADTCISAWEALPPGQGLKLAHLTLHAALVSSAGSAVVSGKSNPASRGNRADSLASIGREGLQSATFHSVRRLLRTCLAIGASKSLESIETSQRKSGAEDAAFRVLPPAIVASLLSRCLLSAAPWDPAQIESAIAELSAKTGESGRARRSLRPKMDGAGMWFDFQRLVSCNGQAYWHPLKRNWIKLREASSPSEFADWFSIASSPSTALPPLPCDVHLRCMTVAIEELLAAAPSIPGIDGGVRSNKGDGIVDSGLVLTAWWVNEAVSLLQIGWPVVVSVTRHPGSLQIVTSSSGEEESGNGAMYASEEAGLVHGVSDAAVSAAQWSVTLLQRLLSLLLWLKSRVGLNTAVTTISSHHTADKPAESTGLMALFSPRELEAEETRESAPSPSVTDSVAKATWECFVRIAQGGEAAVESILEDSLPCLFPAQVFGFRGGGSFASDHPSTPPSPSTTESGERIQRRRVLLSLEHSLLGLQVAVLGGVVSNREAGEGGPAADADRQDWYQYVEPWRGGSLALWTGWGGKFTRGAGMQAGASGDWVASLLLQRVLAAVDIDPHEAMSQQLHGGHKIDMNLSRLRSWPKTGGPWLWRHLALLERVVTVAPSASSQVLPIINACLAVGGTLSSPLLDRMRVAALRMTVAAKVAQEAFSSGTTVEPSAASSSRIGEQAQQIATADIKTIRRVGSLFQPGPPPRAAYGTLQYSSATHTAAPQVSDYEQCLFSAAQESFVDQHRTGTLVSGATSPITIHIAMQPCWDPRWGVCVEMQARLTNNMRTAVGPLR